MNVDILLTGVTGFVGRFVLLNILETQPVDTKIAVLIRPSGNKTPVERFRDEVVGCSLFADKAEALASVVIVGASLESVNDVAHILKSTRRIIHCAANVKHYDPYDALERDNVHNVRKIIELGEKLKCQTLTVLGTCYVHPKQVLRGPVARVSGERDEFYNDYTYTKWRGEELIYDMIDNEETTIPCINLLRLSCVGSPLRQDLQAHPFTAMAHLGIISFIYKGYLRVISAKAQSRISVIPVDIAAAEIVARTCKDGPRGLQLAQLCPPPEATEFHFSTSLMADVMRDDFGVDTCKFIESDSSEVRLLPWYYRALALVHKRTARMVELHEKIQEFLYLFSDNDVRFESSCADAFPQGLDERAIVRDTCSYAERIYQQFQITRGYPLPFNDRFWHRLANKEPVVSAITVAEGVREEEWPVYKSKLWTTMNMHRKMMGVFKDKEFGTEVLSIDDYFGAPLHAEATTAELLENFLATGGCLRGWKLTPIMAGGFITHIMLQFDHGLTDGIGISRLIKQFREVIMGEEPMHAESIPKRREPMPLWKNILIGICYIFTLVSALIMAWPPTKTGVADVATDTLKVQKYGRTTFTGHLLWRLTHALKNHTKLDAHIIAVTAASGYSNNGIMQNNFVSVLLPVNSNMSEREFEERATWIHASSVIMISKFIQWFLEEYRYDWVRDWFTNRVSAILSTLQAVGKPSCIKNINVCTTTPGNIPLSVTALSIGGVSNLTVRSHNPMLSADSVMNDLKD